MELINLEKVNELLNNHYYESYELVVYNDEDGFDLLEFYELNFIKDIKNVCKQIIKDIKEFNHIEIRLNEGVDDDWDQLTIYKHK
jgi:hypothetical protein